MVSKIIVSILILVTLYFNIKHGIAGVSGNMPPDQAKFMTDIGIGNSWFMPIGIASLLICGLVLFPQTFFYGCLINAFLILVIMAKALQAGVLKTALIEIPFLMIPLVMIYLGHPLKSS